MDKRIEAIVSIPLNGTENGKIEVATLSEPYGSDSAPVASIGIFLNAGSEEPDWKIHIPKANIDAVIAALEEAKAAL